MTPVLVGEMLIATTLLSALMIIVGVIFGGLLRYKRKWAKLIVKEKVANTICGLCHTNCEESCNFCGTKTHYECAAELKDEKCYSCGLLHMAKCDHSWEIANVAYGCRPIYIKKYMLAYLPKNYKKYVVLNGDSLETVESHRTLLSIHISNETMSDRVCLKCGLKEMKLTETLCSHIKREIEIMDRAERAIKLLTKN